MNKKKPGTLSKLFASHPQPADRREKSMNLVARFPEREEYVISTSEFQRVKDRLMRQTNARATTMMDIDEGTPGKPTLKRRAPETDDPNGTSTSGSGSSSSQDSGPPKLKRRDAEPTPTPTPTPQN